MNEIIFQKYFFVLFLCRVLSSEYSVVLALYSVYFGCKLMSEGCREKLGSILFVSFTAWNWRKEEEETKDLIFFLSDEIIVRD